MAKAYNKGTCCPYHFRKCLTSDLDFIMEFNNMQAEKAKQQEHEQKIIDAMNSLPQR